MKLKVLYVQGTTIITLKKKLFYLIQYKYSKIKRN